MTYKLTQAQYARIYGVTERSIRTYQRQDLPLDEPGKTVLILLDRKTRPPSFAVRPLEVISLSYNQEAGILPPAPVATPRDLVVIDVGDALSDLEDIRQEVGKLVEDHQLPGWEQIHEHLEQMCAPIDAIYRLAGCTELMARAGAELPA